MSKFECDLSHLASTTGQSMHPTTIWYYGCDIAYDMLETCLFKGMEYYVKMFVMYWIGDCKGDILTLLILES